MRGLGRDGGGHTSKELFAAPCSDCGGEGKEKRERGALELAGSCVKGGGMVRLGLLLVQRD